MPNSILTSHGPFKSNIVLIGRGRALTLLLANQFRALISHLDSRTCTAKPYWFVCELIVGRSKLLENNDKVVNQIHTKRVHAQDFKDDKACRARVLQIDFAMNCSCEYQNEVQSAVIQNNKVDTFLICSDSKDNGKETFFAFIDFLYDHIIKDEHAEVVWTDGHASEFKNKYVVKI